MESRSGPRFTESFSWINVSDKLLAENYANNLSVKTTLENIFMR